MTPMFLKCINPSVVSWSELLQDRFYIVFDESELDNEYWLLTCRGIFSKRRKDRFELNGKFK